MREKYPMLDAADALQFIAIQEGFLKYLAGESKPQLVTADESLKQAAEKEGITVIFVNENG
jgi:rRNA-processing protein FCF1